jgi:general secretion pathway protein G
MIGVALVLGLVVLLALAAPIGGQDIKLAKAQLGCKSLAMAIEKYVENEANKKHELPNTLHDLVEPPFGGPSFLRNDEADLLDPWGKPYEMERREFKDGSEYILVRTTAPDGTPICQYGIGTNAFPKP